MSNYIVILGAIDFDYYQSAKQEWEKHDCELVSFTSVDEFLFDLQKKKYCLIAVSKVSLTESLRSAINKLRRASSLPIIILAPEYDSEEKKEVIQLGADEYITYRESLEERVVSAAALVRRYASYRKQKNPPEGVISFNNILVIEEYHRVFISGKEVHLTPTEFKLLVLLMRNRMTLFTYDDLLCRVWGEEYEGSSRNLVWHQIKSLRKKLGIKQNSSNLIANIHSIGYRFEM